jgi:hypothetical protein
MQMLQAYYLGRDAFTHQVIYPRISAFPAYAIGRLCVFSVGSDCKKLLVIW